MQVLTSENKRITWDRITLTYQAVEKIDPKMVHIITDTGYYAFIGGDTKINGNDKGDADQIILALPLIGTK
jgi:hypothetical protein